MTSPPPHRSGWHALADDVYRLALPYPGGYVNSYLVLSGDGARLIDTGHHWAAGRAELRRQLSELGVRPADIRQILLSHGHPDHVGLTAELAAGGAEVLIHRAELDADGFLPNRFEEAVLREQGLLPELEMPPDERSQLPDGVIPLAGTETLEFGPLSLRLIATPGHSPGLFCAFESGRRWLFSSDQLMRVLTPLYIMDRSRDDPYGRYLQSLKLLGDLDADLALPGHGRPFGELDRHLERAVDLQVRRLCEVHEAIPAQGCTAHQLCRRLGWTGEIAIARHSYADAFALGRVLAYLRRLELEGAARQVGTGWWVRA